MSEDKELTEFELVAHKIDYEGFDYCFRNYSDWEEIKDDEFQKLRQAYVDAANELEWYIMDKVE